MAVRTIGTDIKLTGEKEFNDGMKAINSNLKTLRTDMAATSAEFDGNANSVSALTAKQKILKESVEQQKVKIDALKSRLALVNKEYGENSAQADRLRQQINQATVAMSKEEKALDDTSKALRMKFNVLRNAASGYISFVDKLAEAKDGLDEFSEKSKKASELLKLVGAPATAIPTAAVKSTAALVKLSAAAVAAGAAVGVAAVTAMAGFAKEAAEAAKAASEAGETLTDTQQKWLAYSDSLGALDAAVAGAKSALGGILLPALQDLSTEGAAFLNDFTKDMEAAAGDTEKQGKILSDYIVKGAKLIKEKLPEYVKLGKELLSGLGEGLSESGPEILDIGLEIVMDMLELIIDNAPLLAEAGTTLIMKLIEGLIDKGPDVLTSAVGMVTQIVSGLAQAAPDLIPAAGQLIVTLITALVQASPQLLLAGLELIYGIISGLIDGLGYIIESADEIIAALVTEFANNAERFKKIGNDIIQKIKQGLSDAWDNFKRWFLDLWNGLFGNLSVKIPVEGSKTSVPKGNLDTSFDVQDTFSRSRSGATYTTGNGKTVNLYFYAKTITEAEIHMIVDIVNRELGDAM